MECAFLEGEVKVYSVLQSGLHVLTPTRTNAPVSKPPLLCFNFPSLSLIHTPN